jgi:hypothetical protein
MAREDTKNTALFYQGPSKPDTMHLLGHIFKAETIITTGL